MTEINIQIRDADTFECDGKTWRAVAFHRPTRGDSFVGANCVDQAYAEFEYPRLIVTEVKPLHRTPTDEDAKRRPACEYRNFEHQEWRGGGYSQLIFVAGPQRFVVSHSDGTIGEWNQCRILNET